MSDIWYLLKKHDSYVYHYTKAETLTEYILPHQQLRFSRFAEVNDSRESKEWVFSFVSATNFNPNFPEIEAQLNQTLKHSWRIGCFVCDPPQATMVGREEPGADTVQRADERGHSRPTMWAHYALRDTGACLVFDRVKLDAAVRGVIRTPLPAVYARRVVYENRRAVITLGRPEALTVALLHINREGWAAAIDTHVKEHLDELYFRKSLDWQSEREYRWAVRDVGMQDFFVPIQSSLIGIALGDQFPEGRRAAVANFVRVNPDVELAIMGWQNGFPQPMTTHWRLLEPTTPRTCG
jgi:Protein of unknown function (DUF2971)